MTDKHLFSNWLFNELFQHHLVFSDGRVMTNEMKLEKYRQFLRKQAKEDINEIYLERKLMVDEILELLNEDLNLDQEERLAFLLESLGMKFTSTGEVVPVEINLSKRRYLGVKEFSLSLWERHIIAEKERIKVLKRDLKILDDWLKSISNPRTEILEAKEDTSKDWKEKERSFRRRTRRVHTKMEVARQNLVKSFHTEYDEAITRVLSPKECPGRVPPKKKKCVASIPSVAVKNNVNKADQLEASLPDNTETRYRENEASQPQISPALDNAQESQMPTTVTPDMKQIDENSTEKMKQLKARKLLMIKKSKKL